MNYRRNLVIVFAHGLRSDALGDSQAWPMRTPNLEKLSERGARLIASSACPADPGGMVSLLTGLHPRQHGYVDQTRGPATCEGWPALLEEAGYHLAGVGCVGSVMPWLKDAVYVADIEQPESAPCRYMAAMREKGIHNAVVQQRRQRLRGGPFEPDRLLIEPDNDIDGFIAVEAQRVISEMPKDKPWALLVIFSGPGNDLPPPTLYDGTVDRDLLKSGFAPPDFTRINALAELDYPRIMLQRLEPNKIAQIRSDYLGRVSLIDHGLGQISSGVEERDDAGRTWTVIASDHGHLLGEHGLVGHRSFLAGAIEVPVVIVPPPPGAASKDFTQDSLVSTVDVAATIASLAGCDMPRAVVGRPLLPVLAGDPILPALSGGCISEFGKRLMLETERYKAIFDTEAQRAIGLYDLLNDASERENLIDSPVGRNLLDALRWRLGDALLPLRAKQV